MHNINATNDQPSAYNVSFSYLLILIIVGVLSTMDGTGTTVARNSTYIGENAIEDIIEIINAEAKLPIYSVPDEKSNVNIITVERSQAPDTSHSAAVEELPTTRFDDKDTWYINIAAFSAKDKASMLVEHAREKGINASQKYVTVNGQKFWRVFVRGFLSPDEAKSYAILMKDQLGLKGFWISKEFDQPRSSKITHNDSEPKTTSNILLGIAERKREELGEGAT